MPGYFSAKLHTATAVVALIAMGGIATADEVYEIGPDQLAFSLSNMDPSVDPGSDFLKYAAGSWLARVDRPDNLPSVGVFSYIQERVKARLLVTLQEASKAADSAEKGSPTQQVGAFYNAYLDIEARNAAGMAPLQEELAAIAAIDDYDALARYLGHWTKGIGVPPLIAMAPSPDLADATKITLYSVSGELGLGDQAAIYAEGDGSAKKQAYQDYIAGILTVAGYAPDRIDAISPTIVALESDLYGGLLTAEDKVDPRAVYNPMTFDELNALIPQINLNLVLDEVGIEKPEGVINYEPRYLQALSAALDEYSMQDIRDLLSFMLIKTFADVLSTDFEDPKRALSEALTGVAVLPPREEQVQELLAGLMGHPTSQLYTEAYFDAETRTEALGMIEQIKGAFRQRIANREWLSEETRVEALRKIDNLYYRVGTPDEWLDYSSVEVGNDPVANLINLTAFGNALEYAKIGKPVVHVQFNGARTLPIAINAQYDPQINGFEVTAAITQPAAFDPTLDAAVNFCRLGGIIGHEMTHGFDATGRRYDAAGNLRNWWTDADTTYFEGEAQKLAEQASRYEALPGKTMNGAAMIGENMADVGGITLAHAALVEFLEENPDENVEIDGFTPAQRCFLSWTQMWAEQNSEAQLSFQLTSTHPPGSYRAIAPLQHVDAFYEAFDIQEGDAMWLAPEKRLNAW
ncbi:M13 family metallopeptidase [Roseobacter ponti]|uniref:M13 family metallopeptidase n=1 Tax=Roseobacter ponti TaxID=1891787 RepID=A0A858SSE2_9RHOB|nr:M13 family metallopeptidase [Roseobacter ponti]QJF51624.1 M13 family metallopeptidase [Roseobacter ponti]